LRRLYLKYNADAIEQKAEADAADFEWPPGIFDGDAEAVAREGSLLGAIKAKREVNLPHRFNPDRVRALEVSRVGLGLLLDGVGVVLEVQPTQVSGQAQLEGVWVLSDAEPALRQELGIAHCPRNFVPQHRLVNRTGPGASNGDRCRRHGGGA